MKLFKNLDTIVDKKLLVNNSPINKKGKIKCQKYFLKDLNPNTTILGKINTDN